MRASGQWSPPDDLTTSAFEPMPRNSTPRDLRDLPDAAAHQVYVYRAISRGPARLFYEEIEEAAGGSEGTEEIAFRFHDLFFYFAKIAGEGVIANLAYASVCRVVNAIRQPKRNWITPCRI